MQLSSTQEGIEKIIEIVDKGGVAIIPADTVYGFFALAHEREAVERIYQIKRRDRRKPFGVYTNAARVGDLVEVTEDGQTLIDAFWPDKALAVLLPKKPSVPDWLSEGVDTLAVITASNRVMKAVIEGVRGPLVGTTVNISGEPEITKGQDALCFEDDVDAILIDDTMPIFGRPSTIVDCSNQPPYVIRLSAIPFETVQAVCPTLELDLAKRIS